jgi:hypothetical protein
VPKYGSKILPTNATLGSFVGTELSYMLYDHTLSVSVDPMVTKSLLGRSSDPICVGPSSHETAKKTAITKRAGRRIKKR